VSHAGPNRRSPRSRWQPKHRFLRRPCPADKRLTGSFARSSVAEVGERSGSQPLRRDRNEQGEDRLALAHTDVGRHLNEASVPASRRPLVLLRLLVSEEERQLEGFSEAKNLSSEEADNASVTFQRSRARLRMVAKLPAPTAQSESHQDSGRGTSDRLGLPRRICECRARRGVSSSPYVEGLHRGLHQVLASGKSGAQKPHR
jgi:hypothetical protein